MCAEAFRGHLGVHTFYVVNTSPFWFWSELVALFCCLKMYPLFFFHFFSQVTAKDAFYRHLWDEVPLFEVSSSRLDSSANLQNI